MKEESRTLDYDEDKDNVKITNSITGNMQTNKKQERPLNFNDLGENVDEDEDDDNLFVIKARPYSKSGIQDNDNNEDDDDNFDDLEKKKIKVKTKASIVKLIKKKNIKVNDKIQFDEEDNIIIDNINRRRDEYVFDEEKKEASAHSGINIEEAKKYLEGEKEIDKKIFRERIKRQHRVNIFYVFF